MSTKNNKLLNIIELIYWVKKGSFPDCSITPGQFNFIASSRERIEFLPYYAMRLCKAWGNHFFSICQPLIAAFSYRKSGRVMP
jgi:hypothetical protein